MSIGTAVNNGIRAANGVVKNAVDIGSRQLANAGQAIDRAGTGLAARSDFWGKAARHVGDNKYLYGAVAVTGTALGTVSVMNNTAHRERALDEAALRREQGLTR